MYINDCDFTAHANEKSPGDVKRCDVPEVSFSAENIETFTATPWPILYTLVMLSGNANSQ